VTSRVNVTTLCFVTHAAYKPTSIAFALEKRHFSYEILSSHSKFVLAVPGPALAQPTLLCGTKSGRSVDKGKLSDLPLLRGSSDDFIWVKNAIANLELEKTSSIDNGDHVLLAGMVSKYFVNGSVEGPNLLSIARSHAGFKLLAKQGNHRIGIPLISAS